MNKKDLRPQSVFQFFDEINHIPRPSKHEERMIEYLRQFGESHGLETVIDNAGNVLIRKGATRTARPSFCRATWIWSATRWLDARRTFCTTP